MASIKLIPSFLGESSLYDILYMFSSSIYFWIFMITKKLIILSFFIITLSSCQKVKDSSEVDVVLIGGGIMSATLGVMLKELDPHINIHLYERLDDVALESSHGYNNAGTGHASYCELNYTPKKEDGSIDITKAVEISEDFEISKQLWAYLVNQGKLNPSFIHTLPHISLVFNDDIGFLRDRYQALLKHPLFLGMQYSEDPLIIKEWLPLVMKDREQNTKVAATRMDIGTDVDFGALSKGLIKSMKASDKFQLFLGHEVVDINKTLDQKWRISVKDVHHHTKKAVIAKFVFIGAGGGTLALLQKSGIKEAKGYGGFPVGGSWLITDKADIVDKHLAKVYGKAKLGSPPMSVPHLDSRFIDGKRSLLFGPFATYSTKFLQEGSYLDWPLSLNLSNIWPMISVGMTNFDLVTYLIGQVLMTKEQQMHSLREYFPNAHSDDFITKVAGQRVQIIKRDNKGKPILQFGTEIVSSHDHSLVGLLGASPGASIAVSIMLEVLHQSFAQEMNTASWQEKIKMMIPSYGQKLDNEEIITKIRNYTKEALKL